jgi:arylsulfatase A-like enzyme
MDHRLKPLNILYLDIDSLRADHLGCHGYHRRTSPNIDELAAGGLRFTRCHTPDAPCLPSRTAMTTGRFGIRTGVVNHGGVASQPRIQGIDRGFTCSLTDANWVAQFQGAGYHTAAFSPFAQRHGAWHWYAGFSEFHNTGGGGMETADAISPRVAEWLARRGTEDAQPFFLWVNLWDPHTPYRTPGAFGNPFENEPLPAWYDETVRAAHWEKAGPHSPQEVNGFEPTPGWLFGNPEWSRRFPSFPDRQPQQITSMEDARRMFDGYDTGVAFADHHVGQIVAELKARGLFDSTAIIVSSDHGENLGELWVYGDHQTADHFTHQVPMIVRWPGITDAHAGGEDGRLMYSIDFAATSLEWAGLKVPEVWDGESFGGDYGVGEGRSRRESLVFSQLAWCAQRAARWSRYLCIETYHDGFHDYPEHMVFDLEADPHEQHDLAPSRPDLVAQGLQILRDWKNAALLKEAGHGVDPLEPVLAEGGPFHLRDAGSSYLERLRETGRAGIAERFATRQRPVGS